MQMLHPLKSMSELLMQTTMNICSWLDVMLVSPSHDVGGAKSVYSCILIVL